LIDALQSISHFKRPCFLNCGDRQMDGQGVQATCGAR